MNAATHPSDLTPSSVRPADRLGFTLFVAALVHVALILGLGFSLSDPSQISKSLEVTLSTFKSDEKPKQADFLAQDNQQGSGSLEHEATLTTTEKAIFQDNELRKVTPPSTPVPPPAREEAPKAALATRSPQQQQTPIKREEEKPSPQQPQVHFDREQLSAEIASLEADLAREVQQYAKRPRVHRQTAVSAARDVSAWYRDDWRKKVERIGNQNYPDEARRQRIYGSLRLLVVIKRDGTLHEMSIIESSGQEVLDQAAIRIVRLAAPFAPFSGELAEQYDQIEMIRTWRFERGDRLMSQ